MLAPTVESGHRDPWIKGKLYHGKWGFEAFTNARGVLYHSAKIDPGVRYPPYSQHTSERKIESRLTP